MVGLEVNDEQARVDMTDLAAMSDASSPLSEAGDARPQTSISVVIPCFNAATVLGPTLESVASQTALPQEIIVVDDGSTDDSVVVASSFGRSVQVIRQENQGVSVARNTGLTHARGDHVIFLDSDDLLAPGALAELWRHLRDHPTSPMVMSFVSFEETPSDPCRTWNATTVDGFFPHLLSNCIAFPGAWLFPRQTVLDVGGFDPGVRIYQFWHFLCKIALTGAHLVPVDFVGAYYRLSATSMIHAASLPQVARGQVDVQTLLCGEILKAHPDVLAKHGEIMFWSAWTAMHRARAGALPESDIVELAEAIEEMARRGPAAVRATKFAFAIRLVGVSWAERIRSLIQRGT